MRAKTQTLQAEYEHVYSGDPALDRSTDSWREKYDRAIESSDMSILPLVPGQKPARFKLRHLTRGERAHVLDRLSRQGPNQACDDAVALGLVAVYDAPEPVEIKRNFQVGRFAAAPEVVLDRVSSMFGEEAVVELWGRIVESFNPRKG